MKITEATKSKAKTIHYLLGEVINDLKPDMTNTRPESFDSPEEELCYHLALMSIGECVSGVNGLDHALNMTAEDVRQMCAEADVTISTALRNCKMNMIGRFTPPPRLTRRAKQCSFDRTRIASTVSATGARSPSPLSVVPSKRRLSPLTSVPPVFEVRPSRRAEHCSGASLATLSGAPHRVFRHSHRKNT